MNFTTITRRAVLGAMTGALAFGAMATTAAADTVRLRFHTFYGTEIDPIADKFRDYVKEASGGSLRIQYFRGGELVASDQFADAVAKGTLDIVHGHGATGPARSTLATSRPVCRAPGRAWRKPRPCSVRTRCRRC